MPIASTACLKNMNPISTHSVIVERHARKNTRMASTAFHGILKRAIMLMFLFLQGPLSSATLTPGPDTVEKVVWSRRSDGSRLFDLPCSGTKLANRKGVRDTAPPYTCGTYARRAVIKHYLREKFGGLQNSDAARKMVVDAVMRLINQTKEAWSLDTARGTRY